MVSEEYDGDRVSNRRRLIYRLYQRFAANRFKLTRRDEEEIKKERR